VPLTIFKRGGQVDGRTAKQVLRHIVRRADVARNAARFNDAATLYGEAIELAPHRADLHIQRGHMLKESGNLAAAEHHYDEALRLAPRDHDLALQRGHFYKLSGRLLEAEQSYRAALALKPNWAEPARWLAEMREAGWRGAGNDDTACIGQSKNHTAAAREENAESVDTGLNAAQIARLVPALARRPVQDLFHHHREELVISQFGRHEPGYWGHARTLRGVEAIRGYCIAEHPIIEVRVLLNGFTIYKAPVAAGYPLPYESDPERVRKYVFNIWYDFSRFVRGRHGLEVRCIDVEGEERSFHDQVVIEEPLAEADHPDSDALVEIVEADPRKLEARIRARPSMVRPARRNLFANPPRSVLVMRTDQLGDLVASIAAIRRLRELMPGARLVGLTTAANGDLAKTLGLFDEIIVIDFPDDKLERRRLMSLVDQEKLRQKLASYAFDIAIDLDKSGVSRELLLLSGAPFLMGVGNGGRWPWLNASFDLNTRDPVNRLECVAHSALTLGLVESLGAMLGDRFAVMRREDLQRDRLVRFGIERHDRYILLHMGARVEFSRWPRYLPLAEMILERTDLSVVLMTDDPSVRLSLSPVLAGNSRLRLLDERLEFDDFDAFVSFADMLVGNDSGPKHLAALRGTPVVTLFTARINWTEWGQEDIGTIISRRVPCAGCNVFHDGADCGKEFACIRDISVAEVFEAMKLT